MSFVERHLLKNSSYVLCSRRKYSRRIVIAQANDQTTDFTVFVEIIIIIKKAAWVFKRIP